LFRAGHVISTYIFDPAVFFGSSMEKSISWTVVLGGPVLCLAAHAVAVSVFSAKTARAFAAVFSPAQADSLAFAMYVAALLSSFSYVCLWLVGTGVFVCLDILLEDTGCYPRLLALTGQAFYSQVPHLILLLIYAASLRVEDVSAAIAAGGESLPEAVALYHGFLHRSALFHLVRNLGIAFQVYLIVLLVVAYQVFSRTSRTRAVVLGVVVFGLLYLPLILRFF